MTLRHIIKLLLILVGLAAIVYVISNFVDTDFGWHLRFGKELSQRELTFSPISGKLTRGFSYTDTYTWSYGGKPWINHEWGGDWLFWQIYSRFGYFPIVIITSLSVWLAFLLAAWIFGQRWSIIPLAVALFSAWSVHHIFVARLAMFSPLFFMLLWISLEKIPQKKYYYLWPVLFWIWSVLHGSWVLGFIVIGIYIAGNSIILVFKKISQYRNIKIIRYCSERFDKNSNWSRQTMINTLIWTAISGIITLLNPYGLDLWKELFRYFTENYYKLYITEWVPSYTYPVFWQTFIAAGISLVFIPIALKKNKISLPQLLLYIAFFVAAVKYKRNALYFSLICVPLLSIAMGEAKQKLLSMNNWKKIITNKITLGIASFFSLTALAFLLACHVIRVNYNNDVWQDIALLKSYPMPVDAVEWLKQKNGDNRAYVFNEFAWGGYLNWTMPEALVFFDGRGTATWHYSLSETMLEHYHSLLTKAGGLKEIETGPAQYILLARSFNALRPDAVNRLLFSKSDLEKIFNSPPLQLKTDLAQSGNWKLAYEDAVAMVWERKMNPTLRQERRVSGRVF